MGTTIDQHYHISINSRAELPAMWLKTESVNMLLQGPTAVPRQTEAPGARHCGDYIQF